MTYEEAVSKIRTHLKSLELKWDDCSEYRIKNYPEDLEAFILR
jgi:hypothetical protein